MRRTKLDFNKFHWANLPTLAAVAILWTGCSSTRPMTMAPQPGQKTFSSAEEASQALVAAAQSNDEKALLEILGPDGRQIVSSGDDTEDANSRANFVQRYQEMHRLVAEPDPALADFHRERHPRFRHIVSALKITQASAERAAGPSGGAGGAA